MSFAVVLLPVTVVLQRSLQLDVAHVLVAKQAWRTHGLVVLLEPASILLETANLLALVAARILEWARLVRLLVWLLVVLVIVGLVLVDWLRGLRRGLVVEALGLLLRAAGRVQRVGGLLVYVGELVDPFLELLELLHLGRTELCRRPLAPIVRHACLSVCRAFDRDSPPDQTCLQTAALA